MARPALGLPDYNKPKQPDQWLSLRDTAKLCGLGYRFLQEAALAREFAVWRTGPHSTAKTLVSVQDLDEWRKRRFIRLPAIH